MTEPDLARTVLVVEDHDLNRQLLTMLVEQQGQRALAAGSIAEVRARLGDELDRHLPLQLFIEGQIYEAKRPAPQLLANGVATDANRHLLLLVASRRS